MSNFKVKKLKEMLKNRNLPTTGSRTELLKRLMEAGISPEEELCAAEHASDDEDDGGCEDLCPGTTSTQVIFHAGEVELLRREKELAEREVELLRRELDVTRMTPRSEEMFVLAESKRWQEFKELVSEFDGNNLDFQRWEGQVNKLLQVTTCR